MREIPLATSFAEAGNRLNPRFLHSFPRLILGPKLETLATDRRASCAIVSAS
jgi:hypothetical protein